MRKAHQRLHPRRLSRLSPQFRRLSPLFRRLLSPRRRHPLLSLPPRRRAQRLLLRRLSRLSLPVQKAVAQKKKAPVVESSDEESSEVAPKKVIKAKSPVQKAVAQKKKAPVVESSDEESSVPAPKAKKSKKAPVVESEEEEEAAPVKAVVADDEEGEFEICVKGLSFQAYEEDIKTHFEQCGEVLNVKLLLRPDGKSKGLAFVKFGKKSHRAQALELSGEEHFGRPLTIEEAQGKKDFNSGAAGFKSAESKYGPPGQADIKTSTLFIGGLSYNSTVESIRGYFASAGEVVRARIVTDRETEKVILVLFSPRDSVTLSSMMSRLPRRPTTALTRATLTADKLDLMPPLREPRDPRVEVSEDKEEDSEEDPEAMELLPATPETQPST